jgi:hypothetical protein
VSFPGSLSNCQQKEKSMWRRRKNYTEEDFEEEWKEEAEYP